MYPDNPVTPSCGDGCGTLPQCASLAFPYVPMQQSSPKQYNADEALNNGSLFPGLNLPFHIQDKARNVVKGPMAELQALEFVVTEMGLYLDTHPDDQEAFALFQQYVALAREGRKRYVELYGPLYQMGAADDDHYTWLHDPWPWDAAGNAAEGGKR